ncbi:FAD-dependent oxidoreductase [Demequina zhanjiangensis]|uniref:FAD-dependent oxidoreductase n=1 Tax=Demequina zhanjiangensis TaxID=3051659 RepID=A0ABT8FYK6_9MICO|nr:FAD-dependent oxidoreductase [Demequina sp. SYSU T00b26]MDN4471917.1 FAD-dependent oxidoreductase [Demequina sp. SYSU T00b26]
MSTATFSHVLEPVALGKLQLRNRVVMVPMGTEMGDHDGHLTDREVAYYAERAAGAGLVCTGINAVTNDYEMIAEGLGRVDTDAATPGLKKLADAFHARGGAVSVQLTAGLGRNINNVDPDNAPISASDNTHWLDPSVICRPLETAEIKVIVQRFKEAAQRCAEAGIDAIDIHGHTGYLIDQFLSPVWNRREDEYGGPVENRVRFAAEIIAAVREGAPDLPVSFRLSVDHRFEGGRGPEESLEIAKVLEAAGLDLLMVDEGSYEAMDYVFPPYYLGDNCMMTHVGTFKKALSIPVLGCGNLTAERAEEAIANGEMDFAGIGRALIADPEWALKLAEGRREDIRPCIRCNQLCVGNAFVGKALGCAVNPRVGMELERVLTPAETSKKVAIIGAGPAGLEAARVAALRGHTVDVYEKSEQLGGVLWPAATPEFKKELRSMIFWWERQLKDLPVTVHLGTEITADSPELDAADEIIVAVGTTPLAPPIPGLDGDNVVEVIDAHLGADLGKRIVVCGGGLSGADFALEMQEAGHDVTIVEMADGVANDLLMINRITLLRDLATQGVTVLAGHKVVEVNDKGVKVDGPDGPVQIAADTVVSAFGVRPATALVEGLTARGNAVAIGDCVKPAKVGDAINAGFEAAFAL